MFVGTPNFWTDSHFRSTISDNGFEKGPVPQLGWGRGINNMCIHEVNGFEKVQQVLASTRILEPIYRLSIPTARPRINFFFFPSKKN